MLPSLLPLLPFLLLLPAAFAAPLSASTSSRRIDIGGRNGTMLTFENEYISAAFRDCMTSADRQHLVCHADITLTMGDAQDCAHFSGHGSLDVHEVRVQRTPHAWDAAAVAALAASSITACACAGANGVWRRSKQ